MSGARTPSITTMLIWHIDAGNYARALQIARYAVKHQINLPDQYERTLATAITDEFGAAYLGGKMPPEDAIDLLANVIDLTAEHDVPDQARAKLHKAIGYALLGKPAQTEPDLDSIAPPTCARALQYLKRATELYEQVGAKKDIERLERRLRNAAPPPDPTSA